MFMENGFLHEVSISEQLTEFIRSQLPGYMVNVLYDTKMIVAQTCVEF